MSVDVKLTEELLMAYADGELDAEQAAQVTSALEHDAAAARQVAQHRALRARLQQELSGTLSEPVPERLMHALQNSAVNESKVVDFQARRESVIRRWRLPEWNAMAASLLVGVALTVMWSSNSNNMLDTERGAMLARGQLAAALSNQLASTTDNQKGSVRIGISYRDHQGAYCRSFTLQQKQVMAGVACRTQDQWQVQLLTGGEQATGEFRQAGSTMPSAVLNLIQQQIEGDPLNAQQEAAARQAHWMTR